MNPARILETLGAVIHQDDDARPHHRGGGRAQSPIPPAGSVKPWQPPKGANPGRRRAIRRSLRAKPANPSNPPKPANPPAAETS